MKKGTILLLLISHLISSVGFSMNVHLCGGSKKSFSLFGLSIGAICKCNHQSHQHSNNCCKDKKIEIKSIKKEVNVKSLIVLKTFQLEGLIQYPLSQKFENKVTVKFVKFYNWHPPNFSQPIYILNRVFRI